MGDAIDVNTGRHASGRPSARGPAQAAWDQANPNYFTSGAGSFAYGQAQQGNQGGFAAYSRAQPQQQSQGTPYNPQQGQNFAGFGSQQGGAFSAWNPNIANNTQAQRPPAFQAQTFNFDGSESQMPNFQQRDAFINNINTQLGQMQGQSWNQPMGAPQFNFGQMWGQAGQMAQQGWQNPFGQVPQSPTQQPPQSPAPGQQSQGQYQDLFQQFGFTPPAGFMDALIQRLQGGSPAGSPQLGPGAGAPATGPAPGRVPTVEQFRQRQQEQNQERFMGDLYARANLQPGASTDELMLGLMNNSRGGAAILQEDISKLPESMRDAMSLYSDLASKLQGSSSAAGDAYRGPLGQNQAQALQQLKTSLSERVETARALQQEYGMSQEEASAWVDREMPLPNSSAVWQDIRNKQQEWKDQQRKPAVPPGGAAQSNPEAMARQISSLQKDLAAARRGETVPGVPRTMQQREQELKQAQQRLSQASAPAAWAWDQAVAKAQQAGRKITPQEAQLYTKMQQERQQAAAKNRLAG